MAGFGAAFSGQWRSSLSVLLTGALCAYIVWYFFRDPELLAGLGRVTLGHVFLLLVLHLAFLLLQAQRSLMVLRHFSGDPGGLRVFFPIFIVSRALNFFMPQVGNVYRAVKLKALSGLSYSMYVGASFFFVWLTLVLTFVIATVGLLAFDFDLTVKGVSVLWVVCGCALVGVGSLFVASRGLIPAWEGPNVSKWMSDRIQQGQRAAVSALRHRVFLIWFPLLTSATAVLSISITGVCFDGLARDVTLAGLVYLFLVTNLVNYFPLTPGNVGVQELVYGGGGVMLGLTLGDGILVSLMIRASGAIALLALAVPCGVFDALRERRA